MRLFYVPPFTAAVSVMYDAVNNSQMIDRGCAVTGIPPFTVAVSVIYDAVCGAQS